MRRTGLKYWIRFEKLGSCLPSRRFTGVFSRSLGIHQWLLFTRINGPEFFAERVQKVLQDLLAGQTDALSVFVETEKARVLSDVPALVIPLPERVDSPLWGHLAQSAVVECE